MLGSHNLGAKIEVQHLATKLLLHSFACTLWWPALLVKLKLDPCLGLHEEYGIHG